MPLYREDASNNLWQLGQSPGGEILKEDGTGTLHRSDEWYRETAVGGFERIYDDRKPPAPTNVSAVWESGSCQVAVTWTNNHEGSGLCDHIEIWRSENGVNLQRIASNLGCLTESYDDVHDASGNPLTNSNFTYFVRVYNAYGSYSSGSDSVTTGTCEA